MADQCIVCLEPLDIEPGTTPPAPVQQLKEQEEQLAIDDSGALPKTNEVAEPQHSNHDNVALIEVCGHMLHDNCLREWTEKANSCPICRQTFHVFNVYDKIGGKFLSTRRVEDKKQVPEFDPRAWADEPPEEPDLPSSRCPVCNSSGDEEVLLLCDGCDAAYHTHCIDLDGVPSGPWFCMECVDAFGPDIIEPVDIIRREGGRLGPRYYFPRTQASMRRARQRARSDEWQGAWGRITGRIWDALELDLDYQDDEDSVVFEGLRRSQQLQEQERREHERWQQRLNIASRLGAREVFANSMPQFVARPLPPQQSREERLAWGALEKAREMESRKRKSRSATAEPNEEAHHEPERKLKRPRTRRLPPQNGESSSSAARDAEPSTRQEQGSHSTASTEAQPSFLASLLKEVEMSTPSDEETLRNIFGPIPSVNDAPSPARSPSVHRQGSITPPTHRASSPQMTLSSHIAPRYPPPNYSPTRGSSSNSVQHSRSSSPQRPAPQEGKSSADNSDAEHRGRRRQQQPGHHSVLELRQPQPRRTENHALPRSQNTSPARSPLPLEVKESISRIVRSALKPHWRSSKLTAEQYESINREISRKIYEEVEDPGAVNEELKQGWERRVTQEVARAVASLKA
ncbi:uncharacterized protein B0T15DRAFT_303181 [Chaetomium strumarium]|uniref:PHD and RING finger domain-containing protein n=1 Tax=Chaetomium strumarium TaxID=1170767 RepID=A0AAJ0LYG9_9PEZI|nr:hypothetical protein B0T15DRAFT_303181 [Chaetomium strumarium]